jgi:hypothetical protein
MATPKTSQLANLASQFPAMTQQTAAIQQSQARQAAGQMVQQQAQGLAPRRPISAAQMGAELYTAQAAASREAAQKAQRGAMAVGRLELEQQQQEKQKLLFERSQGIGANLRKQEQQLQKLNSDVKANLYDKAMKFEKDEVGRTLWKTSQLLDYAVRKTQRTEDFRKLETQVGQMQKRRTQLLRTSQATIEQALKQEFTKLEAARDRDLEDRLTKAAAEIKRKIAEDRAKAAERSSMWTSVGSMLGTVVGAAAGIALTVGTAGIGAAAIAGAAGAGALAGEKLGAGLAGLAQSGTAPSPKSMSREEIRQKIRGGR